MKRIFYIILISTSLVIIVFSNGETVIFSEISRGEDDSILRETKRDNLENLGIALFKNNIEKYVGIINLNYIAPTIISFSIIVGIYLILSEFFASTITIRGPPALRYQLNML